MMGFKRFILYWSGGHDSLVGKASFPCQMASWLISHAPEAPCQISFGFDSLLILHSKMRIA
jgi:hypothetical protein